MIAYKRTRMNHDIRIHVNPDWSGDAEISITRWSIDNNSRADVAVTHDAYNLAKGVVTSPGDVIEAHEWFMVVAFASELYTAHRIKTGIDRVLNARDM